MHLDVAHILQGDLHAEEAVIAVDIPIQEEIAVRRDAEAPEMRSQKL